MVFVIIFGQILNKNLAIYYFLGSVVVGITGGIVCYYLLEKPFLRFGVRKINFKRPVNT